MTLSDRQLSAAFTSGTALAIFNRFFTILLLCAIAAVSNSVSAQALTTVEIGSGTLDYDRVVGPRWERVDFAPQSSGSQTISVTWNSEADIRYNVFEADGTRLSTTTISGENPGNWSGDLDADAFYYIGIWSSSGIGSYVASLELTSPLTITSQPLELTVTEGDDATFAVVATGSGTLGYQWSGNGVVIAGATTSTLTISPTTQADSGTVYSVTVSDENGSIESNGATLTVDPATTPLVITAQPVDLTVTEGDDATFTVAATGSGTLGYQWAANGVDIAGATTATLVISPSTLADSATVYSVTVSDENGSLDSAGATLTVDPAVAPLVITAQPADLTVTDGDDATFTVTATGSGTLGYQWSADGVDIAGAATSTFTISSTTLADSGTVYSVTVSDQNGSIDSAGATLTVEPVVTPLVITAQPADVTVAEGDNATFTVSATGSGTLAYQWFANDSLVTGAIDSSLTISPSTLADSGTVYSVTVSDENGSIDSTDATLTVDPAPTAPVITAQPSDLSVTEGDDATFTVAATGSGTLGYQWAANGVEIAGATTATLVISPSTLDNSGTVYSVTVSDENGSIDSTGATLTVDPAAAPLVITAQPADLTVTEGDDATFTVTATGSGTLGYQWAANGVDIAGATTATLTVSPSTLADSGTVYSVTVSDQNSSIDSTGATLTVDPAATPLVITAQPADVSVTEGDDATFTVSAAGSGTLAYQWFANDSLVTGAIDSTLTISPSTLADSGTVYSVTVSDENGSIDSTGATLTVDPAATPLVITAQPADVNVTEGDDATFTVSATGSGTLAYQWFANGVTIAGATNASLTISPTTLADSGTVYSVTVSDDNGSIESTGAILTIEGIATYVETETAEDGSISRWKIIDNNPTGAVINNVFDNDLNSQVIEFVGAGFTNAYRIGGTNANNGWNYTSFPAITWRHKTTERFGIFVALTTTNGFRWANYDNKISSLGFYNEKYLHVGLGAEYKDGSWRTVTRDLAADVASIEPGNSLIAVHGVLVRGNLRIDDIVLSTDISITPLTIASQPADLTVTEGEDATFSVVATGIGNLEYQWFANGVTIAGATNASLTISPTILADSDTVYSVTVSDDNSSIESTGAILTIEGIATHVETETAEDGSISRWKIIDNNPTGAVINNVFDNELNSRVIEFVGAGFTNAYRIGGTNANNGWNYTSFPAITWRHKTTERFGIFVALTTTNGFRWANYDNKISSLGFYNEKYLHVGLGAEYKDGSWRTVTRDLAADVASIEPGNSLIAVHGVLVRGNLRIDDIVLSTDISITPLTIASQPADLTVTEGEDATFSVVATGIGNLEYQWFANGVTIAGATNASLTISPTTLADSGTVYSVTVSDDNRSIESTGATLTINPVIVPPVISTQPADLTVTEGDDASFSVVASGSGALSYQWFADGVAISGETNSTISISPAILSDSGTVYSVIVSDDFSSTTSDNATLMVNESIAPVTVVDIGQGILDSNQTTGPSWVGLEFDALATALHKITVTWDSDADIRFNVFEENGTKINSSTIKGVKPGIWTGLLEEGSSYYIGLWSADGIGNYSAVVEATVPVSITKQPSGIIVTEGDNATFTVSATGSGTLSYQWLANGIAIPGETFDTLLVVSTSLSENNTEYTVEVSNGFETVTSDPAILTVNEPIVLGLFSQDADPGAWVLAGPAPTLDYDAGLDTDGWGRVLLRVGDILLVGGDFVGIKPTRNGDLTPRPFLAALDAISGQPVSTFQIPPEVNSVVRALVLSPSGTQIYVGGDFGLLVLDANTGNLDHQISVTDDGVPGRVFDVAVTDTQLYIGGDFNRVADTYRANIARLSLDGVLDPTWTPQVTNGFSAGRSAPVQSLAVSPGEDIVYIGGNFTFIDETPVPTTPQNNRISMMSVSALDGSVQPEVFAPFIGSNTKGLTAHDIAVTEFYVIVAWGGPNYLSFHSTDGTRLQQYRANGDVQALQVVGDHVFVGHHGEFFGFLPDPIPQEALISLEPEIIKPYKFHSFRIDDPSFLPEQAWPIVGVFGVWGIAAAEDSVWIAGQISTAGSNDHPVDGLVRFPALTQ